MPYTEHPEKSMMVTEWMGADEIFPSSYGLTTGEEFCYKLKENLLAKKKVETEVVYRGGTKNKEVTVKLIHRMERDRYDYRKTPLTNTDGSRINIIKPDIVGNKPNLERYWKDGKPRGEQ